MTTSSNASPDSQSQVPAWAVPLSSYTEQRLRNMERFTSRVLSTDSGFDELTLAQASSVTALGQLLVAMLRDRENRRS